MAKKIVNSLTSCVENRVEKGTGDPPLKVIKIKKKMHKTRPPVLTHEQLHTLNQCVVLSASAINEIYKILCSVKETS